MRISPTFRCICGRATTASAIFRRRPSVFRKLSVEENILAVLETQSSTWQERRAKMEGLLDQLGLGHIRKNKGYALSGGERRRVEIARALCINPNLHPAG